VTADGLVRLWENLSLGADKDFVDMALNFTQKQDECPKLLVQVWVLFLSLEAFIFLQRTQNPNSKGIDVFASNQQKFVPNLNLKSNGLLYPELYSCTIAIHWNAFAFRSFFSKWVGLYHSRHCQTLASQETRRKACEVGCLSKD
jgi:hypothetical protein